MNHETVSRAPGGRAAHICPSSPSWFPGTDLVGMGARPSLDGDEGIPDFRPGGEFTVGAEDELLLVDARGHLLGRSAETVRAALPPGDGTGGRITGEVFVDQVELNTPACADADAVATSLGTLRARLKGCGAQAMAVGVHPEAGFGSAWMAGGTRYEGIVDELAGLFRTPTAAFQVHVGVPDVATAVTVYRALRNRLPLLRALAASSPFWHGRDSGLVSARSAITRSYPRVGVPPVLHSWDDYVTVTRRILAAADLPDYTHVWWDLRPQPRLGTLEVRVMDAQPSLARVAGLTALVQAIARRSVAAPDTVDLPDDVLAANDFRACRHGLETTVVTLDGVARPLREVAAATLAEARALAPADRRGGPLDVVESMLHGPSEARRHRVLHARGGMEALLADLLTRTGLERW